MRSSFPVSITVEAKFNPKTNTYRYLACVIRDREHPNGTIAVPERRPQRHAKRLLGDDTSQR